MENPPKYVRLNNTTLEYNESRDLYYRSNGNWEIDYRYIDGVLYSWSHLYPHRQRLHRIKLIEITKQEHEINNGRKIKK